MKKLIFAIINFAAIGAFAQIEQIWITQSDSNANKAAINWHSKQKGDASVKFGTDKNNLKEIRKIYETPQNLHSIEVDISKRDTVFYYSVKTGNQESEIYSFKSYPSKGRQLRVVSIGNAGYFNSKNNVYVKNIMKCDPHLVVSCGDNIPALHKNGKPVAYDDVSMYLSLVSRCPELFRETIFISVPGNHDKEFKSRGKSRPDSANPVYDINATAFKKFFKFPDAEWYWSVKFADHDVRLVGLDLCHVQDLGTGWQACHAYDAQSEQFTWYKKLMSSQNEKFVVTFYNENNPAMRKLCGGIWKKEFEKGSLCVSGFGYYMELAKTKSGFPYINNSLNVGDHYKDKANAVWSEKVGGFLLLRFCPDGTLKSEFIDIKNSDILYKAEIASRK